MKRNRNSANRAAKVTEETIAAILRSTGVAFEYQAVIGRTIYGTDLRVDFVLKNIGEYPRGLALESKWQDGGGTVDEKFPYLVTNIQECYPIPAIIVVHGGGHRAGAVQWLRDHCDGDLLVAVYQLEEFISWIMRTELILPSQISKPYA